MEDLIKFLNLSRQIIFFIYLSTLYFIESVRTGSGAHPASLGPTQPPIQGVMGFSSGGIAAGACH